MSRDTIGHSSIQPWSAGPLFPAVIARVERYPAARTYRVLLTHAIQAPIVRVKAVSEAAALAWIAPNGQPARVLDVEPGEPSTSWALTLDSRTEEYATREDAEKVARALLADPDVRRRWVGRGAYARLAS